jgi:hypothetical protein
MMELKITKPQERTVYPDIGDNLNQPEEDRFAIVLARPSDQKLSEATIEMVYNDENELEQRYNWRGAARAFIRKLVNAPTLNINGHKRPARVDDLFRYDELVPALRAVNEAVAEMRNDDDEEASEKNS